MNDIPKPIKLIPPGTEPLRGLIGLTGPSNSGKTYSALRMATGIREGLRSDKPIAMVDTEGRGHIYERRFKFDRYVMEPPYSPYNFIDVIRYLDNRYSVIIVDNFSDEFEGIGGLLEIADASKNPNEVGKWSEPKAQNKKLMQVVTRAKSQFIFLLRAIDKIVPPLKGQKEPQKLGWTPVCEKNLIYDLVLGFMLPPDSKGHAEIWKEIEGFDFPDVCQITENHGYAIARWIRGEDFSLEPPEMLRLVTIVDEENLTYYAGTIFAEAVKAYGTVKNTTSNKGLIAHLNVEALEILLTYAGGKTLERLKAEINIAHNYNGE